jgi:hypothetical protein
MKDLTPKTTELINTMYDETGHIGPHNCPERWVKKCRELEEEANQYRTALRFIAAWGGKQHETECGTISCNGSWCAEQARSSLPDEDWVSLSNKQTCNQGEMPNNHK